MKLEQVILQDTRANQPAATDVAVGTLFGVTDEGNIIERSNGTTWEAYSPSGSGSAITALTGDVTATGPGSVAATIANDAVTYAKMQNISAASKLLGRGSASGAGNTEEITLGTNLSMSGTTLNATDTDTGINQLTGDVTAGPGNGSQAATIGNNKVVTAMILDANVTLAKIVNVAADKLLGRGNGGGSGVSQEITLGTNLSMSGTTLNAAGGGGTSGLVPLGTYTASAQATLDIVSRNSSGQSGAIFQSDFKFYQFNIVRAFPVTDNVSLLIRASTNGGSSYISSTDYVSIYNYRNSANAAGGAGSTSATSGHVLGSIDNTVLDGGANGILTMFDPLNASANKTWYTQGTFRANDTNYYLMQSSGWLKSATAVNAVQFLMDSGNISTMTIQVYGLITP